MKLWCLIILAILGTSCGTRKRVVEIQKVQVQQRKEIKMLLQNDITGNVSVWSRENRIELTPINPDLESNFNGQIFKNTKVTIEEKETDSTATSRDLSVKELIDNSTLDIKAKDKIIDLKTKKPNPWLWIGLVVVACFALWLFFKNKS